MIEIIKVFFVGSLISFLGQLPLGNMNLTATQLSVQENFKNAWKYGLGIVLVEIIYLRLALTGMDWVVEHKVLFAIMGWLTVIVFVVLGVLAFVMAQKQTSPKKGLLLNNKMNRFLLGVVVSGINPAQIPFWFLWSTQLLNSKLLLPTTAQFNLFTAGAGLGSLAGLAVYIHGGKWMITKLKTSNKGLNIFMGVVFILAGLFQLYNMLFKKNT
ncbi:MAG TPA: LysE family transporter [Chitinophagaceae bacterium]|jgi:threonine/homoserine/homoserine lactone efflux protein